MHNIESCENEKAGQENNSLYTKELANAKHKWIEYAQVNLNE